MVFYMPKILLHTRNRLIMGVIDLKKVCGRDSSFFGHEATHPCGCVGEHPVD